LTTPVNLQRRSADATNIERDAATNRDHHMDAAGTWTQPTGSAASHETDEVDACGDNPLGRRNRLLRR
jgi:hypothetical protein